MTIQRIQGHICILCTNIIFGLCIPMLKHLADGYIAAEALTAFRFFGAACLFWIAGAFIKPERVPLKDMALMFMFAMFAIVLNQGFFIFGLKLSSPVDASVIVTMTPLIVMALSAVFLRDPITRRKFIGVCSGAGGALWLVLSTAKIANSTGTPGGDMLILASGFSTAIYFTFSKNLALKYSPITMLKWMFLFAAIVCLPASPWIIGEDSIKSSLGWKEYAMICYAIGGAAFLSYLLMTFAIKRMRPTTLAMYNYVQPFVATAAAVWVGQDSFSAEKYCAALLVFLGVYLVTSSPSPSKREC